MVAPVGHVGAVVRKLDSLDKSAEWGSSGVPLDDSGYSEGTTDEYPIIRARVSEEDGDYADFEFGSSDGWGEGADSNFNAHYRHYQEGLVSPEERVYAQVRKSGREGPSCLNWVLSLGTLPARLLAMMTNCTLLLPCHTSRPMLRLGVLADCIVDTRCCNMTTIPAAGLCPESSAPVPPAVCTLHLDQRRSPGGPRAPPGERRSLGALYCCLRALHAAPEVHTYVASWLGSLAYVSGDAQLCGRGAGAGREQGGAEGGERVRQREGAPAAVVGVSPECRRHSRV